MELSKLPILKLIYPPFGKNDSTMLVKLTIDRVDF
jgi:hypothetical protein